MSSLLAIKTMIYGCVFNIRSTAVCVFVCVCVCVCVGGGEGGSRFKETVHGKNNAGSRSQLR